MKKILSCLLLLFVISFTGCFEMKTGKLSPDEESRIRITASIPENYKKKLTVFKTAYVEYDVDKVVNTFFPENTGLLVENKGINVVYGEDMLHSVGIGFLEKSEFSAPKYTPYLAYNNYGGRNKENSAGRLDSTNRKVELTPALDMNNNQEITSGNIPFTAYSSIEKKDKEKMLAEIQQICSSCGLPDIDIRYAMYRSADILNENANIYKEFLKNGFGLETEEEVGTFTEEDEDYYVVGEVRIDDVPLANSSWQEKASQSTAVRIRMQFTPSLELEVFNCESLFRTIEKEREVTVSSPMEAIRAFENTYGILNTITGIEQVYVVVSKEDGLHAVPAWMITSASQTKLENGFVLNNYHVTAFDAETLQIITE